MRCVRQSLMVSCLLRKIGITSYSNTCKYYASIHLTILIIHTRQYYLPPFDQITKDHMKAVLAGQKKFLKMNEVKFCNPPAYDEIGVKALYDKIMTDKVVKMYFPEKLPKGRQMDKSYLYNVWNTIREDDVKQVIAHANSIRYSLESEKVRDNTIVITD